jgi:RNA polymerase sigma factor (sigma-70 family)
MLLRELFEAGARRIVAVMPGGFHPFHPGHKSLYDWAVKTFGQSNVYVAATNDTATRPFPFEVKKQLASMAGVPSDKFIQVKSPFNVNSYKDLLGNDSAIVFVRSLKDKTEQPLPDRTKKDGSAGYLKTYTGKDLEAYNTSGYMAYGPTINFDFSGMQIKSASELRATWPNMSDEDKHKAAALMYGNGHDKAVELLDKALGATTEAIAVEPYAKGYQTDVSRAAKIDLKTAIKTLNPREQEVIQMRFQHDMTFDAIGKELGVSKDRVSQILAKIIRKLKHPSRGVVEPTTEAIAVEPHAKGYQKDKLTMPQNTLVIDTPGDLDWYKLGQDIANLDQADPHEYGQGDSDVVVTSASPEEMQKLMKQLDRLGLKYKAIGSTHDQPEIHATENFADGKKPGRKGLAKRSGINTKASVSSLRKTAKSSSGEKQRMAHWLANMKAGKAKKK